MASPLPKPSFVLQTATRAVCSPACPPAHLPSHMHQFHVTTHFIVLPQTQARASRKAVCQPHRRSLSPHMAANCRQACLFSSPCVLRTPSQQQPCLPSCPPLSIVTTASHPLYFFPTPLAMQRPSTSDHDTLHHPPTLPSAAAALFPSSHVTLLAASPVLPRDPACRCHECSPHAHASPFRSPAHTCSPAVDHHSTPTPHAIITPHPFNCHPSVAPHAIITPHPFNSRPLCRHAPPLNSHPSCHLHASPIPLPPLMPSCPTAQSRPSCHHRIPFSSGPTYHPRALLCLFGLFCLASQRPTPGSYG